MNRVLRFAIPAIVIAAILLAAAPASAKAKPPAKRYYLALFVGMEGPYSVGAACMKFTNSQISVMGEPVSGPWERIEDDGDQTLFSTNMNTTMEILGVVVPVSLNGLAVADDTGAKSAIGGAGSMIVEMAGVAENIAMAGREVAKKSKCTKMARQLNQLFEAAGVALERK